MDEIRRIRGALKRIRLRDLGEVERGTKIPFATLVKIKYGTTKYPRFQNVKKLAAYFRLNGQKAAKVA